MQWEYKKVFVGSLKEDTMISEKELNKLGDQGWELAATYDGYFYFKREKKVKASLPKRKHANKVGKLNPLKDREAHPSYCACFLCR